MEIENRMWQGIQSLRERVADHHKDMSTRDLALASIAILLCDMSTVFESSYAELNWIRRILEGDELSEEELEEKEYN